MKAGVKLGWVSFWQKKCLTQEILRYMRGTKRLGFTESYWSPKDKYCESFGHVCYSAAEEVEEGCDLDRQLVNRCQHFSAMAMTICPSGTCDMKASGRNKWSIWEKVESRKGFPSFLLTQSPRPVPLDYQKLLKVKWSTPEDSWQQISFHAPAFCPCPSTQSVEIRLGKVHYKYWAILSNISIYWFIFEALVQAVLKHECPLPCNAVKLRLRQAHRGHFGHAVQLQKEANCIRACK